MFFSREGDTLFKVYSYLMKNGDSVETYISTIKPEGENIVWDYGWAQRELEHADEKANSWSGEDGKFKYTKLDSLHILGTSGQLSDTLVRTLPISTFLIRAKHDFLNRR